MRIIVYNPLNDAFSAPDHEYASPFFFLPERKTICAQRQPESRFWAQKFFDENDKNRRTEKQQIPGRSGLRQDALYACGGGVNIDRYAPSRRILRDLFFRSGVVIPIISDFFRFVKMKKRRNRQKVVFSPPCGKSSGRVPISNDPRRRGTDNGSQNRLNRSERGIASIFMQNRGVRGLFRDAKNEKNHEKPLTNAPRRSII